MITITNLKSHEDTPSSRASFEKEYEEQLWSKVPPHIVISVLQQKLGYFRTVATSLVTLTSIFPSLIASLICKGCGLWGKWIVGKPKPVLYDAKSVAIHSCETVVWSPRSILLDQLRSNLIASKLQKKTLGGAWSQKTLAAAFYTHTTNLTTSNLIATTLSLQGRRLEWSGW